MAENKRIFESHGLVLPPLRLVLGDVSPTEQENLYRMKNGQKPVRELESTVKKIIAHLKENDK
jgi:hypothetical protein